MRYPEFRHQELFVGSGVIEAACKTVIGRRLNNLACSGPFEEPTPSSPFAAIVSAASSKITGLTAGRRPPDPHRFVAHPPAAVREPSGCPRHPTLLWGGMTKGFRRFGVGLML